MTRNIAYLSLGSNMGDRLEFLKMAVDYLEKHESIAVLTLSSIYETEPVGYINQPQFLNLVVKVSTTLSPIELLKYCQLIEQELGRIRKFRWGPRVIDLDILLYNEENIKMDELLVPHPRMHERAFVLVPLLEIDRSLTIPNLTTPLVDVLDEIPDKEGVRLWKQINGEDASALFEN